MTASPVSWPRPTGLRITTASTADTTSRRANCRPCPRTSPKSSPRAAASSACLSARSPSSKGPQAHPNAGTPQPDPLPCSLAPPSPSMVSPLLTRRPRGSNIPAMGAPWLNRGDPWFPAFLIAAAAAVASLIVLAVVLYRAYEEAPRGVAADKPADSGGAAANVDLDTPLTFSGPLPRALAGANLKLAARPSKADITFQPDATDGTVTRYFVPVASLGTGMDALTSAQAAALLSGEVTDWSAVGGLPGRVTLAAVVGPAEAPGQALLTRWMGIVAEKATMFGSYTDLRAAMTIHSGMFALIPLDEVRFTGAALAIDGMDPVRRPGDLAAWPFAERLGVSAGTKKGEAAAPAIRAAITAQPPAHITVVATGDILQSRCSLARIRETGDWAAALRGPVAEYLASASLTLASLDGSIQDIGTPHGCVQTTNLTSPPEVIEALTISGIDEVTVATNHVFDCGQVYCGNRAFLRTLELLELANIKVTGGGKDLEAALAPAIFEVDGIRFGVLGFDDIAAEDFEATATEPGTAPLDDSYDDERALVPRSPAFFQSAEMLGLTRFTGRIRQLKSEVDVVIVQVQSGTENTHRPSVRSIKALRAAADAGADLVVGNQAHWVQAVEVRGDSFIAYALGNFVFDQTHTPEHTEGFLLEATFHGKTLAAVRFVPYQIENKFRPVFVAGETRLKILADVFAAARDLPEP
ncbi:MAG: hypothetical protein C0506_14505 [Anaerolinea sp.]|nr:hypothetical protein [Anaerolinea sp.]